MTRGAAATRRSPGPFHCVACKTYVTGTEAGHCPRCGWVPPVAPSVARERGKRGTLLVVVALLGAVAIALLAHLASS